MNKIAVGVKGVDDILMGGIPEGKSILLSGNCGAGKTVFASHFIMEGLKNKETAVYISLEQDKQNLISDLEEMGIMWDHYEKKNKLRIIGGNLAYVRMLKDKRKAHFEDVIQEIKAVVIELGAKRVAIDSINLFLQLFDDISEQRNCFAQLNYELQQLGCTILYTCEIPEISQKLSWYGFEEFVVDGVLLLRRNYEKELNMNKRFLEVIKMRGTDYKEGTFPFRITKEGMEVYKNDPSSEFFH
ncbi:hypothetical protein EXS74_01230 [Candidatus Woesearchaeota archaeon]|nr:hypothetical protein [Candidatus Woesearchaeota archaeon]